MSNSYKENYLKAVRFERPDYIPMVFAINGACYERYDNDSLFELMENHKFLFPNFKKPTDFKPSFWGNTNVEKPYTDDFGCVWKTVMNGIVGTVVEHPLEKWENYDNYVFPSANHSNGLHPMDWDSFIKDCKYNLERGDLVVGSLRHGHTFLQLCDLRGYENLLLDMMDEEPLLDDLICKLEEFNLEQINYFIKANVDVVMIPEDLGMQKGPMLSLDNFIRYIKPSYQRLIEPVKKAGKLIHMHSDGDIRVLIDEIIDGGVDIINLQDLVNGIDWIAEKISGKTCVDLDIDRQLVTPFGTPKDIDSLVREEVEKIGCKDGGLTMVYGLYPGVPLENVKALMDAMEKYAFYYC